jgi:uncharacterized protein YdeI (BOF family)
MKIITTAILILLTVTALFPLLGCGKKVETFGQPLTEPNLTAISSILSSPKEFSGKRVRVEGQITDVCPAGGWFFLQDKTGTIYVNLHPSYFAIPQIRGRQVGTEGIVRKEGTQVEIIGEGVELK